MARGRMLNRTISTDNRVAQLGVHAALLYTWSMPHLDVDGRLTGLPLSVRGLVVPALARLHPDEWTDEQVAAYMEEWARTTPAPLVELYTGDGVAAAFFPGFAKNQRLRRDHEAVSVLPPPPSLLLQQLPITAELGTAAVPFPEVPTLGRKHEVPPSTLAAARENVSFEQGRTSADQKMPEVQVQVEVQEEVEVNPPDQKVLGTHRAREAAVSGLVDKSLEAGRARSDAAPDVSLAEAIIWTGAGAWADTLIEGPLAGSIARNTRSNLVDVFGELGANRADWALEELLAEIARKASLGEDPIRNRSGYLVGIGNEQLRRLGRPSRRARR